MELEGIKGEEIIRLFTDPVRWCETFLRDPNNKDEPLSLRSYQREIIEKTKDYRRIVLRYGRRMGKSVLMCADTLWWCAAYPLVRVITGQAKRQLPFRIIIATPYDTQINELWTIYTALIADSPLLKQLLKKIRASDPQTIEFDNGSTIEGHTIGISSSNKGTSLRSLSADMVFLDEMDFIPREIIEQVIMPIWTTHPECRLRVCSTPSGQRSLFWEWCTRADELGWLHKHYPSWHPDNSNWMSVEQAKERGVSVVDSTEFQVRAITDSATYDREYGGEFGEEFGGVYKQSLINSSLIKYNRAIDLTNSDVFDPGFQQDLNNLYIMGVDWNSYINGGQIVIVEYCRASTVHSYYDDTTQQDVTIDFTNKYRLFYRIGIKAKESTQRKTREEIIRLLKTLKIDYVYVDYGAGDTNIEELTFFGKDHPEFELHKKLRVIDSGASVEHFDPVLGKMVKKRNKSLMVSISVLNLEEGAYILPKEEDEKTRLVGQFRGYNVKNVTARGDYTYEGEDHILDAFNLAVYGFQKEYGKLLNNRLIYNILFLNDPRLAQYPDRKKEASSPITTISQNFRDPELPPTRKAMLPRMIRQPFRRQNIESKRGLF